MALSRPVLCLGDPLVDLIGERPDCFVVHAGGVMANVAVAAARSGARVALAGGAGDDAWGRWLRDRLAAEGVGLEAFRLVAERSTPLALVPIDPAGEADYAVYGDADAPWFSSRTLADALDAASGVCVGSNTLVDERAREATLEAVRSSLAADRPVVFDPNLRLGRWRSVADAAARANACVPGALLVRCNAQEAAVLTGEDDLERAASALLKAGARLVVISLGTGGAILRGELRADVPGVPVADLRSTIGAGDVLTGVLLARLALAGWYPPAVAAALPEAVGRAAAACAHWGALD